MKTADLVIAVNTVWVVVAAILVMFMQAGFAFLEAGLTRMKNAAHIAGKNVLIFGVCSIVYWAVGFGIALLLTLALWAGANHGTLPSTHLKKRSRPARWCTSCQDGCPKITLNWPQEEMMPDQEILSGKGSDLQKREIFALISSERLSSQRQRIISGIMPISLSAWTEC